MERSKNLDLTTSTTSLVQNEIMFRPIFGALVGFVTRIFYKIKY